MSRIVGIGTATPANVVVGTSFTSGGGADQQGTMANQGSANYTPSGTAPVPIYAGYYDGSGVVEQVSVPAADVLTGTTIASVAGTMPNQGDPTFTPTAETQTGPAGYYAGLTVGASTYQSGSGSISTTVLTLTFSAAVSLVTVLWESTDGPFGAGGVGFFDSRGGNTVFYGNGASEAVAVAGLGTAVVTLTASLTWGYNPSLVFGM